VTVNALYDTFRFHRSNHGNHSSFAAEIR